MTFLFPTGDELVHVGTSKIRLNYCYTSRVLVSVFRPDSDSPNRTLLFFRRLSPAGCDILFFAHALASKRPQLLGNCKQLRTHYFSYAVYALNFLASGSLKSKLTLFKFTNGAKNIKETSSVMFTPFSLCTT